MKAFGFDLIWCLESLVVLYGLSSYLIDSNFLPHQVIAKWGRAGFPVVAHGGFWGDLLVLPALFWYFTNEYGDHWTNETLGRAIKIGLGLALANHILLIFTQTIPDPFGWKGEKMSFTIFFHFLYFWLAATFIALMYFTSGGVSLSLAVIGSGVLGVHMMAGMHIPLAVLQEHFQWKWCPQGLIHTQLILMQIGLWITLAGFATYAASWQAGVWVLVIGAAAAFTAVVALPFISLISAAFHLLTGE